MCDAGSYESGLYLTVAGLALIVTFLLGRPLNLGKNGTDSLHPVIAEVVQSKSLEQGDEQFVVHLPGLRF